MSSSTPKMLHQRALQLPVIGLHPFRAAPPWRDRAFRERLCRIGNHQIGIADQLRPQAVAGRARAEMAVKGKMFRRELAQREARLRVAVIGRIAKFFPSLFRFGVRALTLAFAFAAAPRSYSPPISAPSRSNPSAAPGSHPAPPADPPPPQSCAAGFSSAGSVPADPARRFRHRPERERSLRASLSRSHREIRPT